MSDGDPNPWSEPTGPFRADQLHDGDPYELSNGHAIHCMTAGGRHARAGVLGGSVLDSDPAVLSTGVDTGIAFNNDKNLRAPDLVVNVDLDGAGWVREAPPLAVEYASVGQDKDDLARKIAELLEFGTRIIWVVHLVGPLRVDVHEPGLPVRTVPGDGELTAPGILQNPVPVLALVDREAAHEATLRNLLARRGHTSLDAVRAEAHERGRALGHEQGRALGHEQGRALGHEQGRALGHEQQLAAVRTHLHAQLAARDWTLTPAQTDRITACTDLGRLLGWLTAAVIADSSEAALR